MGGGGGGGALRPSKTQVSYPCHLLGCGGRPVRVAAQRLDEFQGLRPQRLRCVYVTTTYLCQLRDDLVYMIYLLA